MKIAGTVVLYNPQKEILDNIQTYLPFIDVLYVMDNSTQEIDFINELKSLNKIKYISLEGNKGIAKALKVATETSIVDGYDFLLSMDQDSKFPTDDFKYIEEQLKNDTSKIGILGVNYIGNGFLTDEKEKSYILKVNDIITSGSFLNLNAYQRIDGYNEDLFIDLVDDDICYQLILKGFDVLIMPNIYLKHNLGENKNIKFLFYKRKIVIHSPLRYYYMYRNFTYLMKYKDANYVKLLKNRKNAFGFKRTLVKFLFGKPRFQILKMISQGVKDGKKGRLGKYEERRNK